MKSLSRFSAVSSFLLAACCLASATPIASGGTVVAAPVLTLPTQYVAVINSTPFTSQAPAGAASTFNGSYTTSVYKDSSNTLCSSVGNCLTFAIQVSNSSSSTDGIETLTAGPFGNGFTYNVGYVAIAGAVAPLIIKDSSTGTISFNFTQNGTWANMIIPGTSSDYLIIQTSATNYAAGNISFQDSQTATVAGFIPVAMTPEPSSLVLLGSGLVGVATTMLRRRQRLV